MARDVHPSGAGWITRFSPVLKGAKISYPVPKGGSKNVSCAQLENSNQKAELKLGFSRGLSPFRGGVDYKV